MRNRIHQKQWDKVVPYAGLNELPASVQEQLARPRRHDLPRVAVLYYGGTIGMHLNEHGHLVPTDNAQELLQPLLIKGVERTINVIWFPVYPRAIDSTNGRWVHWVTIGNAIKLLYDLVDGFVVCGGTDTMAHMMASMHFMFPNIGKPIVGCGSQLAFYRPAGDAERNLYFALLAAISNLSGPHLAFADVLRNGLHIFKVADRKFEAFDCPDRHIIGDYDGEAHIYPSAPPRNQLVTSARLEYKPRFREGIKVVRLSPATSSRSILHDAKDPDCFALLLITFGAGNVRDESCYRGEMTHIHAMRKLHRQGFPVVLGSPMMDGVVDSPYAAGAKAVSEDVGGISGGNTCGVTLEVKMMHCLDLAWDKDHDRLNYEAFRAAMLRNHVDELTSNGA